MAAVDLFYPPKQAPGHKTAKSARLGLNLRTKATRLVGPDLGTHELFNIPKNCFINEIHLYVSGAVAGAITGTVGDGGAVDRFMDNTITALGTTGWKSSRGDAQPGSQGYLYTAKDTIDLVIGGTPTAGTIDAWVSYQHDWDELDLAP